MDNAETEKKLKEARDEGQLEGILFALRIVNEVLDETGESKVSVSGMYSAVDQQFQSVKSKIKKLQGR